MLPPSPHAAGPPGQPSVLVVTTCWWPSLARLAHRLQLAGCRISLLCPPGHPALAIPGVTAFAQSAFAPLPALARAIEASGADVIVPGDDRAVAHLHRLHRAGTDAERRLIEASLGDPAHYPTTSSRVAVLRAAREAGLAVPLDAPIGRLADIRAWAASVRAPWVMKMDGAWSGAGVRIVDDLHQAERTWRQLRRGTRLHVALKRCLVNRDPFWLADRAQGRVRAVSVQAYVPGRPGNLALFCRQGEVLAAAVCDVEASWGPTGPSTIVRIVDRPALVSAAGRLARDLGLNGFIGIDYVIEPGGRLVMIELNPRATSLCNLPLGPGRDLVAAAASCWTGRPVAAPAAPSTDLVAHFPLCQHWSADDPRLPACYQDIPVEQPALVEAMLAPAWPERSLPARLAARGRALLDRQSSGPVRLAGVARRVAASDQTGSRIG
jgi:hypothetical protein